MTNRFASLSGRPSWISAFALLGALTLEAAQAQESYLYAGSVLNQGLSVGTLEVEGGALYSSDAVSVAGQLVANQGIPLSVEWVGSEVWLGRSSGIERLTWPGLQSVGILQEGVRAPVIVPSASGATVFAGGANPEVIEYDLTGTVVARTPFFEVQGAAEAPGGWFVAPAISVFGESMILKVDSTFQVIGPVGVDFPALADQLGQFIFPERITRLSNGQYAVAGAVVVGLMDSAGTALSVFDPGQFESHVLEVEDGQLFVPAGSRSSILDPSTGSTLPVVRPPAPSSQVAYSSHSMNLGGQPIMQRTCVTSPNSVGPGGRLSIVGSDDLGRLAFTVGATGLPSGSFSLAIYGQTPFASPFGSGILCISPFAPGLRRSAAQAVDATGASSAPFFFPVTAGGEGITAGSTWIFQVVYRDFAGGVVGFNSTDSVRVTFAD